MHLPNVLLKKDQADYILPKRSGSLVKGSRVYEKNKCLEPVRVAMDKLTRHLDIYHTDRDPLTGKEVKIFGDFHDLRHTLATTYLKNRGQVERLQKLLGHSKIETTMRYVHILGEDLKTDVDKIIDFKLS